MPLNVNKIREGKPNFSLVRYAIANWEFALLLIRSSAHSLFALLLFTLSLEIAHFNPNQRGMPATTKEGALEEKIQLAEGAGFSRQKRLTLRAR